MLQTYDYRSIHILFGDSYLYFFLLLYAKMMYYYRVFFFVQLYILKKDTRVSAPIFFLMLDFPMKEKHTRILPLCA